MSEELWYDEFLEKLLHLYPKKARLVQALVDLLLLERESVYRRLRGDIDFTTSEMIKIALEWNISLDEMVGIQPEKFPFKVQPVNRSDRSIREALFMQQFSNPLQFFSRSPNAEYMEVCNKVPTAFFSGFAYLNQYFMFKWLYQYSLPNEVMTFSQAAVSYDKTQLLNEFYQCSKQIECSNFIFDSLLFQHLVNDIQYFHSIKMISDEEKELLKNNLRCLVDYVADVASRGHYPETEKRVNIYILQLDMDTNYSYFCANDIKLCFIHVFDQFEVHSFSSDTFIQYKEWLQGTKRYSSKISEVDEKSRVDYFIKQRQIIDSL